MAGQVVVVGSINVDHTVVLDRFPQPGETLLAESMTLSVGGKGANQAVAAAKSGADVVMIGAVGDDADGETALRALERASVECSRIRRVQGTPTGSAWITVASGDNTIVVVPGANDHWPRPTQPLPAADVVLCQLEIPRATVEATADAAGMFMLNAAPSQPLSGALLARCDVLIVNEHELTEVSGRQPLAAADEAAVISASHALIQRGVTMVVTTLGGRGALLCRADVTMRATAPRVEVVDTTGAGDAFCGVFAAQVAAGARLADALRLAVTAGSLSVQSATAQGGYDGFADLGDLVRRTPVVTVLPDV